MTHTSRRQPSPSDQEIEVADRLHSAAIRLLRGVRSVDKATGLSSPRLSALSVVVFAGPITLGKLAEAEQVRPPSMSRLVKALEEDGLVSREPDERDGRVQHIRATRKGRRLLQKGRERRVAKLASQIAAISDPERRQLSRAVALLERLNETEA